MTQATTLWLTGLSGAGKSTLAKAVLLRLQAQGVASVTVDGDELRKGLCSDLGFSREDRRENIRRAAQLCHTLNASGVVAIAALISPYQEDRQAARRVIGDVHFKEVWLSTPLQECEKRDPKGLYQKARAGMIAEFTGVNAPYEIPNAPDLTLDTQAQPIDACVTQLMALLK